jgi:LysR family transcriptional regulator of beta-lactamase
MLCKQSIGAPAVASGGEQCYFERVMSSPRAGFTPSSVSLNALRAFEASARHLSFTKAAEELCVTQAAISHQVKALEERIGAALFRRTPKGLVLTDEGMALAPTLTDTFERMQRLLERFDGGRLREVLTVGVVGTFAVGWLLPRLADFREQHPLIDLRLLTNNNKVDIVGESLDFAIRFGDGAWHGVESERIMDAPFAPLCSPATAARLHEPSDLAALPLLRSYRPQDWPTWLEAAGVGEISARGPLFDSSWVMVQAAMLDEGVALAPPKMFERTLAEGRLVQPFPLEVDLGAYWLTRLMTRPLTPAMAAFREWVLQA